MSTVKLIRDYYTGVAGNINVLYVLLLNLAICFIAV